MPHPVISRRLVYPLQERALGRPTFGYLADLERSQWLPREEVERIQCEKLGQLLRVALAHCPWHAERIRSHGLADLVERNALTLSDLRRLPPMTKQDAREHGEAMRWKDVPGGSFRYNTGG